MGADVPVRVSVGLLVAGLGWRLAGIPAAGRALVRGTAAAGETERTIAATLLVKAGDRSVPPVTDAVLTGRAPVELIDVLGSIDTPAARAALTRVTGTATLPRPVRAAAAAALRALDQA